MWCLFVRFELVGFWGVWVLVCVFWWIIGMEEEK